MADFSPYELMQTKAVYEYQDGSTYKEKKRTYSGIVNFFAVIGDPSTGENWDSYPKPTILKPDGTTYANIAEWLDAFFRALTTLTTNSYRDVEYIGPTKSVTSMLND